MKRKELKVYYADLEGQLYISNPFPGHDDTDTFIRKSEADKVMDAMEQRIKELEAEVIGYKASLERANFKMCEKDARIRELEDDLNHEIELQGKAIKRIRELEDDLNHEIELQGKAIKRIRELEAKENG